MVITNYNCFSFIWWTYRFKPRYSGCSIYLYDFLVSTILGISAFYHDSAAAIVIDGKVIAAAQEERFTRKKHDPGYPFNAINFVLEYSKLKLSEIEKIVFYEKPFLKFERLLETYVAMSPKGFVQFSKAMPSWLSQKLFQKKMLIDLLKQHDKNFAPEKKNFFFRTSFKSCC